MTIKFTHAKTLHDNLRGQAAARRFRFLDIGESLNERAMTSIAVAAAVLVVATVALLMGMV